jgi:hypothetical protein
MTIFLLLEHTTKIYGINPSFTFVSGARSIESPLLWLSDKTSYMAFSYELSGVNATARIRISSHILCYSDVGGHVPGTLETKPVDHEMETTGEAGTMCYRLIDVDNWSGCTTFKVKTTVESSAGLLQIHDIQFGSESLCSHDIQDEVPLQCMFDDWDCGVQNDACGLVDWEIRSDSDVNTYGQTSTDCNKQTGIPLLRRKISDTCSYEYLDIGKLQPSGFTVTHDKTATREVPTEGIGSRVTRSSGYSVYLDPSPSNGVAIGVLNLPEVQHSSSNAFLTFYYEMVGGGLHDLVVTVVCTSDPSRFLVPLRDGGIHYHKSNFDGSGSSGKLCLNIHKFVHPNACSTFVIQIHAAAVQTAIIVDDIFFAENLHSYCNDAEN